jgi:hypothetical protein
MNPVRSTIDATKSLAFSLLLPDWRRVGELQKGYTIILPAPMDMPFLLRLGLEGLRHVDTENCRQILIVPDGWGDDGGAAIRKVASEFDDSRIEVVDLSRRDYWLIRSMRPPGSAATHWMQVVNGTKHARCEYAFLHDADAFFLEEQGLERHYLEACERKMHTLGVTPRWDPFFTELGYSIPGTWELFYSVGWARSRKPYALKGRRLRTPHGWHTFDSMLHPQYLDYASGRIGVTETPPAFVHFNGTIFTYRLYRDSGDRQVRDDFFRILLLALLADVVDPDRTDNSLPRPVDLAKGLTSAETKVCYDSATCTQQFPIFRELLEQLCTTPMFFGMREEKLHRTIAPFDDHFSWNRGCTVAPSGNEPLMRVAGLS